MHLYKRINYLGCFMLRHYFFLWLYLLEICLTIQNIQPKAAPVKLSLVGYPLQALSGRLQVAGSVPLILS